MLEMTENMPTQKPAAECVHRTINESQKVRTTQGTFISWLLGSNMNLGRAIHFLLALKFLFYLFLHCLQLNPGLTHGRQGLYHWTTPSASLPT